MRKLLIAIILLFYCQSGYTQTFNVNHVNNELLVTYDAYTLCKWGTAFQILENGYVTKVGMHVSPNEGGDHLILLWENTGNQNILFAGPFVWNISSGVQGWYEFEFPSPIPVFANKTYILSIVNNAENTVANREYFNAITTKGKLRNPQEQTAGNQGSSPQIDWHIINSARVIVNPKLTAGVIGTDQKICSNKAPATLAPLTPASGGTGTYSYQWQSSLDNNTWTDISGANHEVFSPPSLSTNTWFRRNVSSGPFGIISCGPVLITVTENLTPGSIGEDQIICNNTAPAVLTQLTAPTGGTGTVIYQWQSSTDNKNWTNISGENLVNYSPPVLTTNNWYRRIVTSSNCDAVSSNSVLITVAANLTPGAIGADQTICYNTAPDGLRLVTAPTGGTGTYSYQWQSSTDNSNWTDISDANLVNFYPPALTVNTFYRLRVTSSICGFVASNTVRITVNANLVPGTVGADQTICYNIVPDSLTQLIVAIGGTGAYSYQWQRSTDDTTWTDITGANLVSFSPPALTTSTWYRRKVTSGICTVSSNTVRITVNSQAGMAQLHDDIAIYNNTSTNFNVTISGGSSPYTINYTRNGTAQTPVSNCLSGNNISTGMLTTGVYTYALTSVTDAYGCNAQSLGNNITVTVLSDQVSLTNKALIVVNSASTSYSDYVYYIKPYLDNFGIPYDVCNIRSVGLPSFDDYAIIIFGHKNVHGSGYPITQLEAAVRDGVGLYSFDSHLFDFPSRFNNLITQQTVNSNRINISNTAHFITQYHTPDIYNSTNNIINLLKYWSLGQTSNLIGGINLATMSSGSNVVSLLQVSQYGNGRIVKWCGYDWVFESTLGPVYGMDDLIWRGIVWAARKPFVMQGLPPMITMRVDDTDGDGGGVINNFEWIKICNEFGIIPWCGTYNNWIPKNYIPTLKTLIDNNRATASPHAFGDGFIYFNHDNLPSFDAAANTRKARDFYIQNGLKISKYFVPHWYEVSSAALPEIRAMGGEFLGIHMLPDNHYYPCPWLNCAPYRINRFGNAANTTPVYYGGYVNLNGIEFFNCLTEIRDDGGYEWYPDNNVVTTAARGIRHLRRSLNSMVLSSLFTHEYYFAPISTANWRETLHRITSSISEYNPEYTSTDYAVQYIRAKNNIRITNVRETHFNIDISYSGNNDLDTKCYLFTEQNGQITYRFVVLPQINGSNNVSVLK